MPTVELPSGTTIEFPEGTDQETMQRVAQRRVQEEQGQQAPDIGIPDTGLRVSDLPSAVQPIARPIAEFGEGFSQEMTQAADALLSPLTEASRRTGRLQAMQAVEGPSGQPQQRAERMAAGEQSTAPVSELLGTERFEPEGLGGRAGELGAQGMMAVSTLANPAVASRLATAQGTSARAALSRLLGSIPQQPFSQILGAEAGAGTALAALEDLPEDLPLVPESLDEPVRAALQVGGASAGGVTGAGAGETARRGARALREMGGRMFRGVEDMAREAIGQPRQTAATRTDPVQDPLAAPEQFQDIGQEVIEGQRMRLEEELTQALDEIQPTDSAAALQRQTRNAVDRFMRRSNRTESRLWEGLDEEQRATPTEVRQSLNEVASDSKLRRPSQLIRSVRDQLGEGEETTTGELLKIRSDALREARRLQNDDPSMDPNAPVVRNAYRVADAALTDLERTMTPEQLERLKDARAFSRIKDRFLRSTAIQEIKNPQQDPGESVTRLLRRSGGLRRGRQLARAERRMRPIEREMGLEARSEDLQGQIEESLRAVLAREAETVTATGERQATTQNLQSFLNQNRSQIREFGDVLAEFENNARRLGNIVSRQQELERSQLARVLDRDPNRFIRSTLNSQNAPSRLREIRQQVENSDILSDESRQQAIEGLRSGVIDTLITQSRRRGLALQQRLEDPGTLNAVREVLPPERISRLRNIAQAAAQAQGETEPTVAGSLAGELASAGAGITGARIGTGLNRFFGGGSIQVPGITAGVSRRLAERISQRNLQMDDVVSMATRNPRFEEWLTRKFPSSVDEQRSMAREAARLVGIMQDQVRRVGENNE